MRCREYRGTVSHAAVSCGPHTYPLQMDRSPYRMEGLDRVRVKNSNTDSSRPPLHPSLYSGLSTGALCRILLGAKL